MKRLNSNEIERLKQDVERRDNKRQYDKYNRKDSPQGKQPFRRKA